MSVEDGRGLQSRKSNMKLDKKENAEKNPGKDLPQISGQGKEGNVNERKRR